VEEAIGQLEVVSSTVFVRDLILGDTNGSSSLAMSLAMVADEVEKRVNATAANTVRCGT
jgi:hypothetical protein